MIDWEEVIKAESTEELKEIKLWLFQENMRLKQERSELEQERTELEQARNKFLDERVKLRDELDELNRRTIMERKRLKEENLFFEKKMAILQEGFRQLEEDRKKFEQERQILIEEAREQQATGQDPGEGSFTAVQLLFRGVNNPLALRKRYRDLIKIFHPDNLFGDANRKSGSRNRMETYKQKIKPEMMNFISGFLKSNIIAED